MKDFFEENNDSTKETREEKWNDSVRLSEDKANTSDKKQEQKPKPQKTMPVSVSVALMIICCIITFVVTSSLYNNRHSADIASAVEKEKEYYSNELSKYRTAFESYKDLAETDSIVRSRYIGEMPDDQLMVDNIMSAYFDTLGDRYGQYYSAIEYKKYTEDRGATNYGIGIVSFKVYDTEFGGIYISDVIEGSPAEKAGLAPGDIIVAVDGKDVTKDSFDECFDSIRGEERTVVKLKIRYAASDETKEISVERGAYKNQTVFYRTYGTDIAYINITNFYDNTDEEFKEAIEKSKDAGIKKYVFDLRNNTGGNLDTVLNMLDLLLPEGPLIRIVDKNGEETVHYSDAENYLDAEMAVIVNGQTASAAELFSSALHDYKAAMLVGTKTFGKGVMQTIKKLESGAAIKLTDYKYMPPYSDCYDGIGITPDVVIDLTGEQRKISYKLSLEDDPQMQAALDTFKK